MNIRKLTSEHLPPALQRAVVKDLTAMETELAAICSDAGILSDGLSRINSAGGKRLRPLLARMSMEFGSAPGEIVPLMTMLELMHTVSLIHDDVVDNAAQRRGTSTINAIDGAPTALRSGDYLLSRAMERLKIYRGTGINELLSEVAQEMCLGELEQHAGRYRLQGVSTEDYALRIRRKTALLMSACCRCGAIAGGAEQSVCQALSDYGLRLGIAFQLQDDLMDCAADAKTGKPRMQDLRSGVVTLPLLMAAQRGGAALITLAERTNKTEADLEMICLEMKRCGALDACAAAAKEAGDQALDAISPLPDGAAKRALALLARSITEVKELG